ncbi:MAG: UvrD-helicase domain-containing protein [Polyangia bacterium]
MSDDTLRDIGTFANDLVVQAGAGTGKTHALVTLYLHLVTGLGEREAPVAPARILVITFTDKAAGELKERIRARLGALCEGGIDAEPSLVAAAERTGRELPSLAALRAALTELTRAPIGTFHAIGQALLRRHAALAGVDPSFSLLDSVEADGRAIDAARAVTLEALAQENAPTAELMEALGFGGRERTGLIEALAKLRAALAEEGRAATGIAAAYEPALLQAELATARAGVHVALFDFERLVRSLEKKSLENGLEVVRLGALFGGPSFDEAQLRKTLGFVRSKDLGESLTETREALKLALTKHTEATASFDAAPHARAIEALVAETERRYAEQKRRDGVVDFGDLIRLPRDVLRDVPEVAQREAARFDAVLVDEFQDTNAVQAELVALLSEGVVPERGGRRFIVGDRKQSIYEFRGADVAVFTQVSAQLRAHGADEVLLRRSFRSAPRVIGLCNVLFEAAFAARASTEAWALSFLPERDALLAERQNAPDSAVELLRTVDDGDEKVSTDVLRRREADAIVDHMRRTIASGRRPGQMALLLRRYTHLGDYLSALSRAGIPHYVVRGRGFYEAQEIRDLASLLLLLVDPDDRLALVSVLRSPLCGLSDEGLGSLVAARQLDTAHVRGTITAPLSDEDRTRLARLRARLADLDVAAERLSPSVLLRRIVQRFDLVPLLAATPEGLQKVANIDQLLLRAAVVERERPPLADLPGFARWLGRAVRPQSSLDEAEAQIVDERDDVVRIMTIHQSKGLEFPVVYVADCGANERGPSGLWYHDPDLGLGLRRPSDGEHTTASKRVYDRRLRRHEAESLRLFYVAATRARDRLIFSGEGKPGTWRGFLDALPPGELDVVPRAKAEPPTPPPPLVERAVDVVSLPVFQSPPPRSARSLRVAVTQLDEFARCERRYHLLHELELDDPVTINEQARKPERHPLIDPLAAGTLAHHLLERCTFGLSDDDTRAELTALAADLDEPGVAEVVEDVASFLRTEYAQGLAGQALRRELPFALSLPARAGEVRIVRGQMDLVRFSTDEVTVIDYKHARRGAPEAYRFQLGAYALAARALYPRAPAIRVGLVYLRDENPGPVWVAVADEQALTHELSTAAERLAAARLDGERRMVPRPVCETMGCGFVDWCHP